ncbi:MAG: hypothetical protein K5876_04420 [Ruminiclostridium sp.]|nr:hypothetical protein [Ruminiclostridium sp.]
MLNDLIIRAETPADYKNAELVAVRSFRNKYWPGCTEHLLIRIIRDSADYIPEISRIAEHDGKIVGAVYYTKAWIADGETKHEIATFGPLAVEPTLEGNYCTVLGTAHSRKARRYGDRKAAGGQ